MGHQEKPQANDSPTNLVHLGGEGQGSFDVEDEEEEGRTRTDVGAQQRPAKQFRDEDNGSSVTFTTPELVEQFRTEQFLCDKSLLGNKPSQLKNDKEEEGRTRTEVCAQQGPAKRCRGEDNGSSGNFISPELVEQFRIKQFLYDKSLWGNKPTRLSSGEFFSANLTGNEAGGSKLIVERAFSCSDVDDNDAAYHLLGAQLFNSLSRNKQGMLLGYMNETVKRMQQTDYKATFVSTLAEVRAKYTEGASSIMQNLPLPCPRRVEGSGYSVVPLENSLNYIMGKGYQLRTLRLDRNEDWFNDDGIYHNEFLQEVHQHLITLRSEGKVPSDLRVIFVIAWSDGFEKNILVKTKDSSLQLFTVWFVPEDGHSDVTKYTAPYALGYKDEDHEHILGMMLSEIAGLQEVTMRFSAHEGKIVPVSVYKMTVSNDYVERCENTHILQNGISSKWWGFASMFTEEVPSCSECRKIRENAVIGCCGQDCKKSDSKYPCNKCADWWANIDETDDNNKAGWYPKPDEFPRGKDCDAEGPVAPEGRELNNCDFLKPCKISFSFLAQAIHFANYHYIRPGGWTKRQFRCYLKHCCVSNKLVERLLVDLDDLNLKGGESLTALCDSVSLPFVLQNFEELCVEIKDFNETPMHLMFLGVFKHYITQIVPR